MLPNGNGMCSAKSIAPKELWGWMVFLYCYKYVAPPELFEPSGYRIADMLCYQTGNGIISTLIYLLEHFPADLR